MTLLIQNKRLINLNTPFVRKESTRLNHSYLGVLTFNQIPSYLKLSLKKSLIDKKILRTWLLDLSPLTIKTISHPSF